MILVIVGTGFIITVVTAAWLVQVSPLEVWLAVTLYIPALAIATGAITGFWFISLNAAGPVHIYSMVPELVVAAFSCKLAPSHRGPLLLTVGRTGV